MINPQTQMFAENVGKSDKKKTIYFLYKRKDIQTNIYFSSKTGKVDIAFKSLKASTFE